MFNRAFEPAGVNMEETIATHNPLGRTGTPEEIASAVLWLSSPGAAFTTGQDITIDGGYTTQ
jgi:3-oxoacyl-[acyl-carrier protein] reductase